MLRFETYKNDIEYPKNLHHYINMKFWDWTDEYGNHYSNKIKYALEMEDQHFYNHRYYPYLYLNYHHYYPYLHYLSCKVDNKDIQHYKDVLSIRKHELTLYRIKKLIKENNLSYEQVEEYLGKEEGYINKILYEDTVLTLRVLDHLTYLFNCSIGYITGRSWGESIVSYDLSTYSSQDLRKFANRNRIYVANKRNIKKILSDKLWK